MLFIYSNLIKMLLFSSFPQSLYTQTWQPGHQQLGLPQIRRKPKEVPYVCTSLFYVQTSPQTANLGLLGVRGAAGRGELMVCLILNHRLHPLGGCLGFDVFML